MTKELQQNNTSNGKLVDRFSRTISYLRLSVTDRCNLRCLYCMPCDTNAADDSQNIYRTIAANELLTYEELLRIVRIAVNLGMSKIRLTGGEPLIRKGIMGFIEQLSVIEKLEQIRLTTNGVLLKNKAESLYGLGIRHLNISLDTLQEDKFANITGKNKLKDVLDGIDEALRLGFRIKLNVVAMKGINDDEFLSFAKLALKKEIQVRFIEFMPIGKGSVWNKKNYISAGSIHEHLAEHYSLLVEPGRGKSGPARVFTISDTEGQQGRIGFISPISHHFCDNCNRLRLTSEGKLRACLLHDGDTDLKSILRLGGDDAEIEMAIRDTILFKPKGHSIENGSEGEDQPACRANMSRIGG